MFNKLIPELSVSDFRKSIDFYTKTIGFKVEYTRPEFALLSFQGSQIMIEQANGRWSTGRLSHPFGRGVNFQIDAKNVDAVLRSIRKHKYPVMKGVMENWYRKGNYLLGCREILVKDPDGYLLRFSQDIGTKRFKRTLRP